MTLSIDFETRSRADLRKVGLYVYAEDPSTEILCLAWALDDGEVGLLLPGDDLPAHVTQHILEDRPVRAWNAAFEFAIWNRICTPRFGWEPLHIEQMRDTMAQAAAMNLPQGLGACAEMLGFPQDQQKDKRGRYLINTLSKPRTTGKQAGEFRNDPDLVQEMYNYCKQDVVVERTISKKLPPLSAYEQKVWCKTLEINERGLPIDVDECSRITEIVDRQVAQYNAELEAMTGVEAGTKRAEMLTWFARQGVYLDDLTGDTVEAEVHKDHPPQVKRALQLRALTTKTSTAKFAKMVQVTNQDGRARGLLTYHGASTGRDASRGGLNVQNLARPPYRDEDDAHYGFSQDFPFAQFWLGDDIMDAAVSCVRGVIHAPQGYSFIDADFSSVENRAAAWIAGQTDKVEDFAAGKDEYKTFACSMYDIAYSEVTKAQRQIAKSAVLGGMFGQGWKGLIDYAAPLGVHLDEEKSRHLIDTYRAQYPKVQAAWYRFGDMAIKAIQMPETAQSTDKVTLYYTKDFLRMKLPSGRIINWYKPEVKMMETPWGEMREGVEVWSQNATSKQWWRSKLIGSSIFQSAVQATARDLLMNAMFNVESAGYKVVLRIHDELLALAPDGFGDPEEFGKLMCTSPEWAQDLPLAFEAWRDKRFHK